MKRKSLGLLARSKDIPEEFRDIIQRKIKYGGIDRNIKIHSLRDAILELHDTGDSYLSYHADNIYLALMFNKFPNYTKRNPFKYSR